MNETLGTAGLAADGQRVLVEKVAAVLASRNILPLCLSAAVLVTAVVVILLAFVFSRVSVHRRRLLLFGGNSLLMGLWYFGDCELVRILILQAHTELLQCAARSALPFLYLYFLRYSGRKRGSDVWEERLTAVCRILSLALMLGAPAFFLRYGRDLSDCFILHLLMIALACAVYVKQKESDGRFDAQPLIRGLCACVALFYLNSMIQPLEGTNTIPSILLLFAVVVALSAGWILYLRRNYMRLEEGSQIREQLVQSRMQLMLSQIQPHFIYNALNSIHILIRKDPDVACSMITNFSDYLRANMDAMGSQNVVSFEKELAHVRAYAEIEKIRFPRIDVVYEIDEWSFLLPVLTVEPLVENAIKHGVAQKRGGGSVIIRAYRNRDDIYIEVIDNGVGFDTAILEEEGTGIGIRNVKYRLERVAGGTLSIESRLDEGTTARIRIPAKEDEIDENDIG